MDICHYLGCTNGWSRFLNGVRTLIPWGVYPVESRDAFDCFYGNGYKQKYRTTLNIDAEISQKLDFITKGLSISIKVHMTIVSIYIKIVLVVLLNSKMFIMLLI